jgi:hypothetical protein
VPFPYLLRAHVKLYYGLSLQSGGYTQLLADGVNYTWTSATQVQLSAAPVVGQTLSIRRETPTTSRLVDWNDGSALTADALDTADLQNFYAIQEHKDYIEVLGINPNTNVTDGSITANKLSSDAVTTIKIQDGAVTSSKIQDGAIVNDDVNASAGIAAGKLSFTQAGGGTARTVDSKLKDVVSVKDFGAVGNGTTDDSAAVQAAINTGKSVAFEKATYLIKNINITQAGTVPGEGNGNRVIDCNGATLKLAGSGHILKIANADFVEIKNARLDLNNVSGGIGIAHSGGWHCSLRNIFSVMATVANDAYDVYIDGGTVAYPGGQLWGAYTSLYQNLYLKRIAAVGSASGGYVTTLNFHNLAVQSGAGAPPGIELSNVGSVNFYNPIIQSCTDGIRLTNSQHIHIYSVYLEGCVNYIKSIGAANTNVISVGGQTSVSGAYLTGTIGGEYWLHDSPTNLMRLQYTGDVTRGRLGYVERETVQNKTTGNSSDEYYTVEPGGWGNANGLARHQYIVQSASPLKAKWNTIMNRGDQTVVARTMMFDPGTGKPWVGYGANSGDPTAGIDLDGYNVRIRSDIPPGSGTASGNKGEIRWDANYIYVCTATDTWKRTALSAF